MGMFYLFYKVWMFVSLLVVAFEICAGAFFEPFPRVACLEN